MRRNAPERPTVEFRYCAVVSVCGVLSTPITAYQKWSITRKLHSGGLRAPPQQPAAQQPGRKDSAGLCLSSH